MAHCLGFSDDPGPCPICGAPHTACTSTGSALVVPIRRPGGLPRLRDVSPTPTPQLVPLPTPQVSETFSTTEYSRAKHGRKRTR